MMTDIDKDHGKAFLQSEAHRIYKIIDQQKKHLCLNQCPVFEEIIDTNLFGFSKQVELAVKTNMITELEGQLMLSDLEKQVNDLYNLFYEDNQERLKNGGGES